MLLFNKLLFKVYMKKIYLLLYAFLLINTIKSDFVNGVKSIFDNQNDKKKDDSTVSILALGGAIGTTFIGNNVKDLKNQLQEAIDDKNQLSLQLQSSQLQSLENNRQEYNQLTEKYNEALEKINSLNKQIDAKLLEKKTEKLNLENPSVLSVENIPVNKLLQQPLPLPLSHNSQMLNNELPQSLEVPKLNALNIQNPPVLQLNQLQPPSLNGNFKQDVLVQPPKLILPAGNSSLLSKQSQQSDYLETLLQDKNSKNMLKNLSTIKENFNKNSAKNAQSALKNNILEDSVLSKLSPTERNNLEILISSNISKMNRFIINQDTISLEQFKQFIKTTGEIDSKVYELGKQINQDKNNYKDAVQSYIDTNISDINSAKSLQDYVILKKKTYPSLDRENFIKTIIKDANQIFSVNRELSDILQKSFINNTSYALFPKEQKNISKESLNLSKEKIAKKKFINPDVKKRSLAFEKQFKTFFDSLNQKINGNIIKKEQDEIIKDLVTDRNSISNQIKFINKDIELYKKHTNENDFNLYNKQEKLLIEKISSVIDCVDKNMAIIKKKYPDSEVLKNLQNIRNDLNERKKILESGILAEQVKLENISEDFFNENNIKKEFADNLKKDINDLSEKYKDIADSYKTITGKSLEGKSKKDVLDTIHDDAQKYFE